MNEKEKKIINLWLLILGAGIFSYSLTRALTLSITYDEADCYRRFVRHTILFSDTTSPVNIQLLNNFLTTVSYKLFGSEAFFLRIPNLLAHILFLVFSARLLKKGMLSWLVIPCFLILNLNPYMLDFFSLARQYGLSFGTMMASIYYLYLFNSEREKNKYAVLSMCFGALAVFSSIVQLNFFLALSGAILVLIVLHSSDQEANGLQKMFRVLKSSSIPVLIAAFVLLTIVPFAIAMKNEDQLFFGQSNGFIKDTLSSTIGSSFYRQVYETYFIDILAFIFVFGTIVFSGALFTYKLIKRSADKNTMFLGILLALICLCALSTIVQFHLLGTLLLYNRTAIFFIILFNLVFLFLMNQLIEKWKKASVVLLTGIALFCVLHFFSCMNIQGVMEWREDADTETMLSDLKKIRDAEQNPDQTKLGISLIFEASIDYYRETKKLTWLSPVQNTAGPIDQGNDYFYLLQWDVKDMDSLIILKTYPFSGSVLAKRGKTRKKFEVLQREKEDYEGDVNKGALFGNDGDGISYSGKGAFCFDAKQDFGCWSTIKINAFPVGQLVGSYSFMTLSEDIDKANIHLVISCDREGAPLRSFSTDVRDFITENDKWSKGELSFILPPDVGPGDELKAYLWNPEGHKLYVDDVRMVLTQEIFN